MADFRFDTECPCPCESGELIKNCCLRPKGILRPKPCVTKPAAPKTGVKNPRCYAGELADCSNKISREHYFSHGVLKAMGENSSVEIAGLPWQPDGERKRLPTSNLVGNILCERHNNALSPLDAIAIRFFNSFDRVDREFAVQSSERKDRVFLFNGHDVERWMLKTLCGVVFSGNASSRQNAIRGWKPNILWLKILFGNVQFPNKWGMYFVGKIGDTCVIDRKLLFAPISNDSLGVYGAIIEVKTKRFILAMASPQHHPDSILARSIYRPIELVMKDGRSEKIVMLGWEIKGDGKGVVIVYQRTDQKRRTG